MPFVPVPDCVQCQIEGRVDAQTVINDLYFRSTIGPRSAVDVTALATALAGWMDATYAPLLNSVYTGVRVRARGLTNPDGFVSEVSLAGTVGGVVGGAAPNNVSMAVSFRTGLGGRSQRGRNYVPIMSKVDLDGNNISGTFAADVVDAYSDLLFPGPVLPGGWIWVVVSRITGGEPRAEGIFHEVMSVLVVDLIVDSMRRRLPGRGN